MDRCSKQKPPTIMNKTQAEIEEAIDRLRKSGLSKDDADLFIGAAEFAVWFPQALQEKDISIKNLRRTIFGKGNGKKNRKNKKNNKDSKNNGNTDSDKSSDAASPENSAPSTDSPAESNQNSNVIDIKAAKPKKPGHGRMGHDAYPDANQVFVPHGQLQPGDYCPEKCGGKVYSFGAGHVIRITGNSFAAVTKFELETLRCALCNIVFTADLPNGISKTEKYDPLFKANLAIQKYFAAMPFYRQENIQMMLGFRLPDSTQFDLVEQVADCAYPVIGALEKIAANGESLQYDDTGAKILSVIKCNKKNPNSNRTGMFTTGIIGKTSVAADQHGQTIALFYTGIRHAGENIKALLENRTILQEKIITMCDALSANTPESLRNIIIECNCLAHGFRKFRDLLDYYPEFCLHVIQELGQVYKNEGTTKGLDKNERLAFHAKHSKPIMDSLFIYLKKQFSEKLIEPNSHLGKAITYMTKRWEKFTMFFTVPGAPIDNNLAERALKIPIRIRKSAMFYKTEHGAHISNILLSLIETAKLNKINPADYFVALQENKSAVHKNPADWVPWMYQKTLKNMQLSIAA